MKSVVVLFVMLTTIGYAQAPDTLWTKTYGGAANDIAYGIQQTWDGGYIIVGETHSFGAGDADVWLLKTDENGDTVWTQTYGGDSADIGYSVQQTADSGYIIAGETRSFGAGGSDVYLIKTDSSGNTLWAQTYGDSFNDGGYSVQDLEDYFIITGYIGFARGADVHLIKTNLDGQIEWERTWGYPTWMEVGYSVRECNAGYIIGGNKWTRGLGSRALLLQTDWAGNPVWNKEFIADGNHVTWGRFMSVQPTTDGCYIAAGGDYPTLLVKTDSLGDSLWVRRDVSGGCIYAVQQINNNGYIFAGYCDPPGDVMLSRTDEDGDTLWFMTYGGTEDDEGYSMQQTTDGGYVIAGYTRSFGAGESDVWLIKTEPDLGIEQGKTEIVTQNEIITTIFRGPLQLPEGKECKVFDITGRVVMPDKIKPGIYFIEIDGSITRKVVKVR